MSELNRLYVGGQAADKVNCTLSPEGYTIYEKTTDGMRTASQVSLLCNTIDDQARELNATDDGSAVYAAYCLRGVFLGKSYQADEVRRANTIIERLRRDSANTDGLTRLEAYLLSSDAAQVIEEAIEKIDEMERAEPADRRRSSIYDIAKRLGKTFAFPGELEAVILLLESCGVYGLSRDMSTGAIYYKRSKNSHVGVAFGETEYKTVKVSANAFGYTWSGKTFTDDRMQEMVHAVSSLSIFDPVVSALDNMPVWDGVDRISALCDHIQVERDAFIELADGTTERALTYCMKYYLKMAVARGYYEQDLHNGTVKSMGAGCPSNLVMIFGGQQGTGKSRVVEWLATPFSYLGNNSFQEISFRTDEERLKYQLANLYFAEIPEIDGNNAKQPSQVMKSLITAKNLTYRPPYGRSYLTIIPRFNLFGTYNREKGKGLFTDATGNRRYCVFDIIENGLDWSYTDIDLDQLWAQAIHLYRTTSLELCNEFKRWQTERNLISTRTNIDETLMDVFEFGEGCTETYTISQVVSILRDYVPQAGTLNTQSVSAAMKRLGAVRCDSNMGGSSIRTSKRLWTNMQMVSIPQAILSNR